MNFLELFFRGNTIVSVAEAFKTVENALKAVIERSCNLRLRAATVSK